MQQRAMFRPPVIMLILSLQFIPLLLFPAEVFAPGSQQWWLPAILTLMVLIADFEVIIRRRATPWPWVLLSLAQGLNIISRLMIIWSQGAKDTHDIIVFHGLYIAMTVVAIALSVFLLWYTEKPQVRIGLLRAEKSAAAA